PRGGRLFAKVRMLAAGDETHAVPAGDPLDGVLGYTRLDADRRQDEGESYRPGPAYWNALYRDVSSVNASEAATMQKTFAKLERGMAKAESDYGRPATFGAYVQRVAKVLGIKQIGFYPPSDDMWANGRAIDFVNLSDGARRIDGLIWDW